MKVELVHGSDAYDTQMLYFTTNSCSDDERYFYFMSDQSGYRNAYVKDTQTGEITQLTDNKEEKPLEYYRDSGIPNRGFGMLALDSTRNLLYYVQDAGLYCTDIRGNTRRVTTLPENEHCSLPHVSSDGKLICFCTVDGRALEGAMPMQPDIFDIDRRIQAENLGSWINVVDIETGKYTLRERVQRGWTTHIQFSPTDSNRILYNHEHTAFDCGIRRVWLWDGKTHRSLRTVGEERHPEDWCCHEFWSADGKYVYWHGRIYNLYAYIGRIELATGKISEILLDHAFSECYGHFSVSCEGNLVSDGYWHDKMIPKHRPADAPIYPSEWITVMQPDWENKTVRVIPICKHSSSWKTQDDHPHPVFNQKGDTVYFTGGMDGRRKVYKCKWK